MNISTTATISSKRQLTIPAEIFRQLNLSKGDKVIVENRSGELIIKKAKAMVEQLSGSIVIDDEKKRVDLDQAIREAKRKRFSA